MQNKSNPLSSSICFTSLALGGQYRALAKLLADDIKTHLPDMRIVLLTDCVSEFEDYDNVLAYQHNNKGVYYCFHDKRFAIAKGLQLFKNCIFVDADCRIGCPPPNTFWEELRPGVHTFWIMNMEKKLISDVEIDEHSKPGGFNTAKRRMKLTYTAAKNEHLDITKTKFIQEVFFVVCSDSGKEKEFLRAWDRLANFFQLRGFGWGEGRSIGLAAQKSGLPIHQMSSIDDWLFKDLYIEARVGKGLALPRWASIFSKERVLIEDEFHKSRLESVVSNLKRITTSLINAVRIILKDPAMASIKD